MMGLAKMKQTAQMRMAHRHAWNCDVACGSSLTYNAARGGDVYE